MQLTQSFLLDLLPDEGGVGITTAQIQERLRSRAIDTKWLKSTRRALQRLEDEGLAYSERQGRHLYWWRRAGVGGMASGSRRRMSLGQALALRILDVAVDTYRVPWVVRTELNALFDAARISLEKAPIGDAHKSWMGRVAVLDEGYARVAPAIDPEVAEKVSMALFKTLRLCLRYTSAEKAGDEAPSLPVLVEPLGWVARNGLHYLVARKTETGELRHYRLDRIRQAEFGKVFLYPGDFSLKLHIEDEGAFDYPGQGKKENVVLRFAREWGKHLLGTPVNGTQEIVERTDKYITVRFEAWDSERLLWWIRGFGPHVEVLQPEGLRGILREDAARACRLYGARQREAVIATSYVGIFWGLPQGRRGWRFLADKTPVDEGEPYGECITHATGHYEYWESLSRLGQTVLAQRGLPGEPAWHEYEEFPRGRVVYWPDSRRFVIYADRRLQAKSFIKRIVAEFGIPADAYSVCSDSHYRSSP